MRTCNLVDTHPPKWYCPFCDDEKWIFIYVIVCFIMEIHSSVFFFFSLMNDLCMHVFHTNQYPYGFEKKLHKIFLFKLPFECLIINTLHLLFWDTSCIISSIIINFVVIVMVKCDPNSSLSQRVKLIFIK